MVDFKVADASACRIFSYEVDELSSNVPTWATVAAEIAERFRLPAAAWHIVLRYADGSGDKVDVSSETEWAQHAWKTCKDQETPLKFDLVPVPIPTPSTSAPSNEAETLPQGSPTPSPVTPDLSASSSDPADPLLSPTAAVVDPYTSLSDALAGSEAAKMQDGDAEDIAMSMIMCGNESSFSWPTSERGSSGDEVAKVEKDGRGDAELANAKESKDTSVQDLDREVEEKEVDVEKEVGVEEEIEVEADLDIERDDQAESAGRDPDLLDATQYIAARPRDLSPIDTAVADGDESEPTAILEHFSTPLTPTFAEVDFPPTAPPVVVASDEPSGVAIAVEDAAGVIGLVGTGETPPAVHDAAAIEPDTRPEDGRFTPQSRVPLAVSTTGSYAEAAPVPNIFLPASDTTSEITTDSFVSSPTWTETPAPLVASIAPPPGITWLALHEEEQRQPALSHRESVSTAATVQPSRPSYNSFISASTAQSNTPELLSRSSHNPSFSPRDRNTFRHPRSTVSSSQRQHNDRPPPPFAGSGALSAAQLIGQLRQTLSCEPTFYYAVKGVLAEFLERNERRMEVVGRNAAPRRAELPRENHLASMVWTVRRAEYEREEEATEVATQSDYVDAVDHERWERKTVTDDDADFDVGTQTDLEDEDDARKRVEQRSAPQRVLNVARRAHKPSNDLVAFIPQLSNSVAGVTHQHRPIAPSPPVRRHTLDTPVPGAAFQPVLERFESHHHSISKPPHPFGLSSSRPRALVPGVESLHRRGQDGVKPSSEKPRGRTYWPQTRSCSFEFDDFA